MKDEKVMITVKVLGQEITMSEEMCETLKGMAFAYSITMSNVNDTEKERNRLKETHLDGLFAMYEIMQKTIDEEKDRLMILFGRKAPKKNGEMVRKGG